MQILPCLSNQTCVFLPFAHFAPVRQYGIVVYKPIFYLISHAARKVTKGYEAYGIIQGCSRGLDDIEEVEEIGLDERKDGYKYAC